MVISAVTKRLSLVIDTGLGSSLLRSVWLNRKLMVLIIVSLPFEEGLNSHQFLFYFLSCDLYGNQFGSDFLKPVCDYFRLFTLKILCTTKNKQKTMLPEL